MGQIKIYNINFNVKGLEDNGQNMYRNTYLTKLRNNPISSKCYENVEQDLDTMIVQIIKRIGKWVKWIAKRS